MIKWSIVIVLFYCILRAMLILKKNLTTGSYIDSRIQTKSTAFFFAAVVVAFCYCSLNICAVSEFSFYLQFEISKLQVTLIRALECSVSSEHENCMKNSIKVYKMKSKSK